jgi:hypothetical protein
MSNQIELLENDLKNLSNQKLKLIESGINHHKEDLKELEDQTNYKIKELINLKKNKIFS